MIYGVQFWVKCAIGAAVIAFIATGIHGLKEASQAKGEAEYLRTVVARDSVKLDSLETEHARREVARSDSIRELQLKRTESEARAREAEAREAEAQKRLTVAEQAVDNAPLPDSVKALVQAEREAHRAIERNLRLRIGELETQNLTLVTENRMLRAGRVDDKATIAALNASNEKRAAEARAWERAANPGLVARITGSLPSVGLGAAAVLVVLVAL